MLEIVVSNNFHTLKFHGLGLTYFLNLEFALEPVECTVVSERNPYEIRCFFFGIVDLPTYLP